MHTPKLHKFLTLAIGRLREEKELVEVLKKEEDLKRAKKNESAITNMKMAMDSIDEAIFYLRQAKI